MTHSCHSRIGSYGITERNTLLRFDIGCSHEPAPLVSEFCNELIELKGRTSKHRIAKLCNPLLQSRISEACIDRLVEEFDDIRRRISGRADTEPTDRLVGRYEFTQSRNVRQCFCASYASHCERA